MVVVVVDQTWDMAASGRVPGSLRRRLDMSVVVVVVAVAVPRM